MKLGQDIVPSFFVIGAQKAGTTTLHEWLSVFPSLSLPKIKETHYFSDEKRYQLGYAWYLKQFTPNLNHSGVLVGEVDPDYLFFDEAAFRLRRLCDCPKLIVLVREPLHRAYSQYLMTRRRGIEPLTFAEALKAEVVRCTGGDRFHLDNHSYLARGMYSQQIKKWKAVFPSSSFLFLKYEDFFKPTHQQEEFKKISKFIGLNSESAKIDFDKKANSASRPRFSWLRDLIYKPSALKKIFGVLIPSQDMKLKLAIWADRLNTVDDNSLKEREWGKDIPPGFYQRCLDEAHELALLTGLDFHDWIDFYNSNNRKVT